MGLRVCADSDGPDQPAHLHSLIRTFAVYLHQSRTMQNLSMNNNDLAETDFAIRIGPKDTFWLPVTVTSCSFILE